MMESKKKEKDITTIADCISSLYVDIRSSFLNIAEIPELKRSGGGILLRKSQLINSHLSIKSKI